MSGTVLKTRKKGKKRLDSCSERVFSLVQNKDKGTSSITLYALLEVFLGHREVSSGAGVIEAARKECTSDRIRKINRH